jgi:hypothetical protein
MAQLSSRRIRTLGTLSRLIVTEAQLPEADRVADLENPMMQRVLLMFLDKVQDTAASVLGDTTAATLAKRWRAAIVAETGATWLAGPTADP